MLQNVWHNEQFSHYDCQKISLETGRNIKDTVQFFSAESLDKYLFSMSLKRHQANFWRTRHSPVFMTYYLLLNEQFSGQGKKSFSYARSYNGQQRCWDTVILEFLRPTSPPPQLYDSTPFPETILDFMSLELAFYSKQQWKKGGCGSQCKPNFNWKRWNAAISTRFRQLSQLLLLPIVWKRYWSILIKYRANLDNMKNSAW